MSLREIMDRIDQRLVALGMSERAAALRAGLAEDTVRSIRRRAEAGEDAGVNSKTLIALADVLRTTSYWLMSGATPEAFPMTAPLIAWSDLGQFTDAARPWPFDAPSGGLDARWDGDYCLAVVPDKSMDRVSPPGAHLLVDRADRVFVEGAYYLGVWRGEVIYRQWWAAPDRAEPCSTDAQYRAVFPTNAERWDLIGRVRRSILDL